MYELNRPIPHLRNAQYFVGEALEKVKRARAEEMMKAEVEKIDFSKEN